MEKIIAVCILLCCTIPGYANKIDKLQTNSDVVQFLAREVDSLWLRTSPFDPNKANNTSFTKAGFIKTDLDSNGLTDLLVYGHNIFAVLDTGSGPYVLRGSYTPLYNTPIESDHEFTGIAWQDKTPLLVLKRLPTDDEHYIPGYDTFIFRFGDFIEYSAAPNQLQIESITFTSDGGWGGIKFDMTIDAGGWATYIAYYGEREIAAGEIDSTAFDKLTQTINYIKFTSLNDWYSLQGVTDQETYTLRVTFAGGRTKEVKDYGGYGTAGLCNIYRQLQQLADGLPRLH